MKFKKQIAMICLFTFLFLPFSKVEEPKAEVIILTTGAIIACAALAVSAGVIITNQDMLQDVGERVFDSIKNIPNSIENIGGNVRLNVTKDIISSVISVCNAIPKIEYYKSKFDSILDSGIYGFSGYELTGSVRKGVLDIMPLSGDTPSSKSLRINIIYGNSVFDTFDFPFDTPIKIYFDLTQREGKINIDGENYTAYSQYNSWQNYSLRLSLPSNYNGTWRVFGYESESSICIPYTPSNTENVSSDKPKELFPAGSGSISAPMNKPLSDYNVSADSPISKPTDLVAEGDIVADKDSDVVIPGDGVLDKPSTDVTDTPSTGESLWDTLMSWLKALFAPLIALLGWIGDILLSILEFLKGLLKSLVDALKGLFEYLFVPTLDIASLILIPDDSGLGQLIQLFDWGDLLDITPKPYIFETNMNINSLVDNESTVWNLKFDLFSNESVDKYMPYVRNILSYTCLIGVMYFVIIHFLPKRDID